MICPVCQVTNKEDANFCTECNYRLSIVCPRCSRRVVSHAKFCDRCGLAVEGEAKWGYEHPSQVGEIKPRSNADTEVSIRSSEGNLDGPQPQVQAQSQVEPMRTSAREEKVVQPAEKRIGATSPLEQYIPRELMKKLETARSSGDMVGERRVVTMLFCDVKGSTQAAEHLDPEEWSEIINGALNI